MYTIHIYLRIRCLVSLEKKNPGYQTSQPRAHPNPMYRIYIPNPIPYQIPVRISSIPSPRVIEIQRKIQRSVVRCGAIQYRKLLAPLLPPNLFTNYHASQVAQLPSQVVERGAFVGGSVARDVQATKRTPARGLR